jgi:2-hydroxyglutaryl-CoA dehydratase, D-component
LDALPNLLAVYESRLGAVPATLDDRPVLVHTGADVPREVLTAAGFVPYRMAGDPARTAADPYCGPGIDRVAVTRFGRLLDGDASASAGLVLSADDEGSVRLFLYLRELLRVRPVPGIPRITFLDLVHLPQRTSAVYNRARLGALIEELGEWAGRPVTDDDLRAATRDEDRVRELVRAVGTRLRHGAEGPRLTGTQALAVIGAAFLLSAERWIALVTELLDTPLPVNPGPRIFLTGADHDHPAAYRAIESAGVVIVGEDHGWGALAGESTVGGHGDMRTALVRSKTLAAPAAAGSAAVVRAEQTVRMALACRADAVVAWTRPYDDGPPWDLPVQRRALADAGLPLVVVAPQAYGTADEDAVRTALAPVAGGLAGAAR